MSSSVTHTYISTKPDDKKIEMPTYVRRISERKYEYGYIAINFDDRRKDTHVPSGTAASYASACRAMNMVPTS